MNTSKLMLGTVQFGLKYGIANQGGQVPYEQVLEILAYAHQNGIQYLDTAAEYGNAEEVLGRALKELKIDFNIVTKIPLLPEEADSVGAFISSKLQRSMELLGRSSLYGCLFHKEQNCIYAAELLKMQSKGLLQHCGVSLDSLAHPALAPEFDLVQLPYNILDRRFEYILQKPGLKKCVRSAFMQGLLLMEHIPEHLQELQPVRQRFEAIRHESGLSRQEFYMLYVLSKPEVDFLVFGVDSLAQLKQNIAIAKMPPLPESIMQQIETLRMDLPEKLLRPMLWKTLIAN
ncbi:MAG: aldo/keto reductase [Oligosphaeraceae bacterium]|nr:aldo/keto reductase [Oligosphaeraceae bacterium]